MSGRFRCRLGKHTWRSRGRGDVLTYVCLACGKTRDNATAAALGRVTSTRWWGRAVRRLNHRSGGIAGALPVRGISGSARSAPRASATRALR